MLIWFHCVILCIVLCKCVLYYCPNPVAVNKYNISHNITSHHIISYHKPNHDKCHIKYRPPNYMNSNSVLNFMSIYRHKLPVNEESIFWTHLKEYASEVSRLIFPSGGANMDRGQSRLLWNVLEMRMRQYQGEGPVNCKNKKFLTHFWWVELLNFNGLLLY